jgi:membrane protein implicated in regulation of membrane protease activity
MMKYSLARVGLFVAVAAILMAVPVHLSPLIKLMIAVIVSALLALVLLRGMRDRVAEQLSGAAARRADEKARLRAALVGDDKTDDEKDEKKEES